MCVTLAILGGNDFQRMGALAGGISKSLMNSTMHHVVEVINRKLKDEFLRFPSNQELRDNVDLNFEKYKLPDFEYAVDGCHFLFKEKPRGLPEGILSTTVFFVDLKITYLVLS